MNRSILDIVVAVQEQQPVSEQDLRLGLLAVAYMLQSAERDIRNLAGAVVEGKTAARLRAHHAQREADIRHKAKEMAPAAYLGEAFTPGTVESQRLQQQARSVLRAATGEELV